MQDHSTTNRPVGRPRVPLVQRFWSNVRKTDSCWFWTGSTNKWGYGKTTESGARGKTVSAHRVSWLLHNGPIPDGLWVLHKCDEHYAPGDISYRRCVNPAHLYLGTHRDNTQDTVRTGRIASGERNGNILHPDRRPRGDAHPARRHPECWARGERQGSAKLTAAQVLAIRERAASQSVTFCALAAEYRVSASTIRRIVRRISWAHI